MLRLHRILTLAAISLPLACVSSLHPWYAEKDLLFDERLLGRWLDEDEEAEWHFIKQSDSSYQLTYTPVEFGPLSIASEPGEAAEFRVHLFHLGDLLLLDMFPEEPPVNNDLYLLHLQGTHTLWRVSFDSNRPRLAFLDDEWLADQVESGELSFEHQTIDGRMILTGSTAELQRLILKIAPREGAFGEPSQFSRVEGATTPLADS